MLVFLIPPFDQQVSVASVNGNVEVFTVTDEHPFFVEGHGWTDAAALRPGHRLISPDGSVQVVTFNVDDYRPEGVTVYNFEVDGNHTYFVGDGVGEVDAYVWVHNACSITSGENVFARKGRQMHNAHADLMAVRISDERSTS